MFVEGKDSEVHFNSTNCDPRERQNQAGKTPLFTVLSCVVGAWRLGWRSVPCSTNFAGTPRELQANGSGRKYHDSPSHAIECERWNLKFVMRDGHSLLRQLQVLG